MCSGCMIVTFFLVRELFYEQDSIAHTTNATVYTTTKNHYKIMHFLRCRFFCPILYLRIPPVSLYPCILCLSVYFLYILYRCVPISLYLYTRASLYPRISTFQSLYIYIPGSLCTYIFISLCLYISVSLYPNILVSLECNI